MLELVQMRHPSVTLTFKPGEVISKLANPSASQEANSTVHEEGVKEVE